VVGGWCEGVVGGGGGDLEGRGGERDEKGMGQGGGRRRGLSG